jgi:uncharacterized protein (TIGR03790 family)
MPIRTRVIILLILTFWGAGFALEPNEVLIVANSEVTESISIARYYCEKRQVPDENFIAWPLGTRLTATISRDDYERKLAEPLRGRLTSLKFNGKIKCLLTVYGVPIMVGRRGQLEDQGNELKYLEVLLEQEKKKIERLEQGNSSGTKNSNNTKITQLQSRIDYILGKETHASVDSELSMVLSSNYELYRWQPNRLMEGSAYLGLNTLMVSRLDGPDEDIVTGLIDKAISAERTGLSGIAYIDSRGIQERKGEFGRYDQSLRDLAMLTRLRTGMAVNEERTRELFAPGSCPGTAVYCGWYSLRKYIDAFDFVDGAVGFHIASFEAVGLRDPNSSSWCPAMLKDGITATLGAVSEPYLHAFPRPSEFFARLYEGDCLVEAYYRTKPFNSWQLLLIGDPLYRPFKKEETKE